MLQGKLTKIADASTAHARCRAAVGSVIGFRHSQAIRLDPPGLLLKRGIKTERAIFDERSDRQKQTIYLLYTDAWTDTRTPVSMC